VSRVSALKRGLTIAGMVIELAGAALTGWSLFRGGGGEAVSPIAFAYQEEADCPGCPVEVRSAEVQDREGSTLFIFRGTWPSTVAQVPGDVRFRANDLQVTLRPAAEGFQIVEGNLAPGDLAADVQQAALLIDLADPSISPPVRFALEVVPESGPAAGTPAAGLLIWSGTGAPRQAGGPKEQPSPQPTETETVEPAPELETPEEFAAALAEAHRDGDDAFLLDRLHPEVIDLYGRQQCAAFVKTIQDETRAYQVAGSSDLEPWPYEPDGRSITVDQVYTVDVEATVAGETSTAELHFGQVGDQLTWFTDCGDPLA
jgi:hypothetical protein